MSDGDTIRHFKLQPWPRSTPASMQPFLRIVSRNDGPLPARAERPPLRLVVRNDDLPRRLTSARLAPELGNAEHLPIPLHDSPAG